MNPTRYEEKQRITALLHQALKDMQQLETMIPFDKENKELVATFLMQKQYISDLQELYNRLEELEPSVTQ